MSPKLFQRQLDAGAWGITVATAQQAVVAARSGVRRVLMANQLVCKRNIHVVADLLDRRQRVAFIETDLCGCARHDHTPLMCL